MTQTKQLSSMSVNSTLADARGEKNLSDHPKSACTCNLHEATSQTTHLDNQLQQPGVKTALQALAAALGDLADENRCTRCVVESSSGILTRRLRDVRAAKENGRWLKEKKALKAEAKGLVKTVKGDVKARWRDDKSWM